MFAPKWPRKTLDAKIRLNCWAIPASICQSVGAEHCSQRIMQWYFILYILYLIVLHCTVLYCTPVLVFTFVISAILSSLLVENLFFIFFNAFNIVIWISFVKTFCGFLTAIRLQGNFSLLALVYFVVMPVRAVVRSSSWCFLMFFVDPKGAKTETASCSQVSVCCVPCFPLIYLVFSLPAPQADGGSVAWSIQQGVSTDVGATAQLHEENSFLWACSDLLGEIVPEK